MVPAPSISKRRPIMLVDSDQARVRERFLQSLQEVQSVTSDLLEEEIAELVETAVTDSRRERAGVDAENL